MNTEKFMNKLETQIFSTLYSLAFILSLFGMLNDNYEILKAVDEMELSKNKREVEIVNDYYIPTESNMIAK